MVLSTFEGQECALIVRLPALCCSRGWDEGFLCFLSLGFVPNTTGGNVTPPPITEFLREKLSMSLRHIMSPCSIELGI